MSRVERHAAEEAARMTDNTNNVENNENESTAGTSGKKKHKRKLTPFGRFIDIIGTLIMVAALLACLALTIPRFVRVQTYVVVSGSMEPTIPVWSLVYAKPVEPASLQPGDVIVFYSTSPSTISDGSVQDGAVPITHRVVENNTETEEIVTKGDANTNTDFYPVAYINVVGKVAAHVPVLGRLAAPLATTMGKIATVMIILAGFLLSEAGNRLRR